MRLWYELRHDTGGHELRARSDGDAARQQASNSRRQRRSPFA